MSLVTTKSKSYSLPSKVQFLKVKFKEIESIDISISHCRDYAVAMVTIITK